MDVARISSLTFARHGIRAARGAGVTRATTLTFTSKKTT
jgi:hypothetical protein